MKKRGKKNGVITSAADLINLAAGTHQIEDVRDFALLTTADNYRPVNREAVDDLKRSIISVGVREPIKLHVILGTGVAEVVAGQHRMLAVQEIRAEAAALGMHFNYRTLPAVVHVAASFTREKTLIDATTSNYAGRESIWDRAAKVANMRSVLGSVEAVADAVNLDRRSVYNALAVQELPDSLRAHLLELGTTVGLKDTKVVQLAVKFQQLVGKSRKTAEAAKQEIMVLLQPKAQPSSVVVAATKPKTVPVKAGGVRGKGRERKISVEDVSSELTRLKSRLSLDEVRAAILDEAISRLTSPHQQRPNDCAGG